MNASDAREPERKKPQEQAVQHIADAHRLLKKLRGTLKEHPEVDEAIERLEMALSVLTMKTGAML